MYRVRILLSFRKDGEVFGEADPPVNNGNERWTAPT